MAGPRRYMRPIAELTADAEALATTLDQSSMPDDEVSQVAIQVATLVYDLIGELEQWRTLLGQQLTVEPCGIVSVMVGPGGALKLVVERKPIRDGGVASG